MARWQVELISKESDRSYVYNVDSLDDRASDEEVARGALVEHGRLILLGRPLEVVHEDRAAVTRIG